MPHMTKPSLHNTHVHITEALEKCWTCAERTPDLCYVGGQTFTLRDPDLGIIACPRCAPGKIL